MKKNRERQLLKLAIISAVILLVVLYIKFFNGSIVYISTGFGRDELFKIEDNKIYGMEVNILLSDTHKEYEKLFGSSIWEQQIEGVSFDEYAKEQVKAKLIRVKCMNLLAKEKGVVLSRAEKEAVTNAVDKYLAGVSEEQQKELLITKEKLTKMFTEFAVAQLLYEDMTSTLDYEISTDEARVINIQYICADSSDAINEAKTRIDNGEIFYVVAKEYNGDNYEAELRRGEMEQAFEDVAFNLVTGETSGIVQAGGKYYIIKCNSDNDNTKTEAYKLELIEQYKLDAFNKKFESYEAKCYVNANEKKWEKVTTASVKEISVSFEEIYNEFLK